MRPRKSPDDREDRESTSNSDGEFVDVVGISSPSELLQVEKAAFISSDDELRNINSFEYLQYIAKQVFSENAPAPDIELHSNVLTILHNIRNKTYDPQKAYGNLYTQFFTALEYEIEKKEDLHWLPDQRKALLNAVFLNENNALERASVMHEDASHHRHIRTGLEARTKALKEEGKKPINAITPQEMDKPVVKISSMATAFFANRFGTNNAVTRLIASKAPDYKPMFTTSQTSVRKYEYTQGKTCPKEIRSGTQAQYTHGVPRVNPIFEAWLKLNEQGRKITHVYFNNLGLDGEGDERDFERRMTIALHESETRHPNLAVITLPADKAMMNHHAYLNPKKEETSLSAAYTKMFCIVADASKTAPHDKGRRSRRNSIIEDFYISPNVERLLYANPAQKNEKIKSLIQASFSKVLGISPDDIAGRTLKKDRKLTEAEFQAVYFHFIKYELTNFILETLQPDSFNTSCKDGIDRGGVSSAYYNLMKSIESGHPMSEKEFHRALHAASTIVKGRGMNAHHEIIWNAIHHYVETNKAASPSPVPDWMENWRNKNAPKGTAAYEDYRTPRVTVKVTP